MKNFYTNVQCIGNHIMFRGVVDGERVSERLDYHPTLFISTDDIYSKYHTLDGDAVDSINPGSVRETRDFIRKYSDVENFNVYGNHNFQYCWIGDQYDGDIEYDRNLVSIIYLDIEVYSQNGFPDPEIASEEITAITIKHKNTYWVLGCGPYTPKDKNVKYIKCDNERDLIVTFVDLWRSIDPDIITGWNVQFFDIPYLINRITRVVNEKLAKKLSPWGRMSIRNAIVHGQEQKAINLIGTCILDYMELYKKFTYTQQESYRLDHIAHVELGERKLSYEEFGSLHNLYSEDYEKFIDYNIKDVELVERLDDKMKFFDMVLALAYSAKVNFNDVFSQVRMWDTMIYNHLRQKNIVIPPKDDSEKLGAYEGAYVKDPIVGMHEWVVSFDLNSLYPHLIMQYNISPETLVDRGDAPDDLVESLHLGPGQTIANIREVINKSFDTKLLSEYDLTVAPNYQFFDTSRKGFLAEMMDDLYKQRSEYKRMMIDAQKKREQLNDDQSELYREYTNDIAKYNNVQLARKVQLNSAYGALGNQYFRFYDTRQAEAVTKAGQLSIRWIEVRVNEYLNKLLETQDVDYVVASDTDSIYVTLHRLVDRLFPNGGETSKIVNFLDKVCQEKIERFIDLQYRDLANYMNAYDHKMFMKREVIADKGVWTAKKRYILNVHDSEGVRYSEPKLKMMGIEAVKSSTPAVCRDKIKQAMRIMMNDTEDDIIKFIEEFREEFYQLPAEDISFPRGINGIKKYKGTKDIYIKGTPIHVRGALIYNDLLVKHGLTKSFPMIQNGDKIKFTYLKEPNTIHESVISISGSLPTEFNLNKYIDYEKQFQKAFVDPLGIILEKIGWNTEKKSTLEDFFA